MKANESVEYHHLHLFVDKLEPLDHYKKMEAAFNEFLSQADFTNPDFNKQELFAAVVARHGLAPPVSAENYSSSGQDLVAQLIAAVGMRIIGTHSGKETESVVLATADPTGLKLVFTALNASNGTISDFANDGKYDEAGKRGL